MRGLTDASAVDARLRRVRLGTPALSAPSVDGQTPKRASTSSGQGTPRATRGARHGAPRSAPRVLQSTRHLGVRRRFGRASPHRASMAKHRRADALVGRKRTRLCLSRNGRRFAFSAVWKLMRINLIIFSYTFIIFHRHSQEVY